MASLHGYTDPVSDRGTIKLAQRQDAISAKLSAPASAVISGTASLTPFAPCSPLATYPSPFSESQTAAVADLMSRTASKQDGTLRTGPSDHIARNYTATAFGLSMQKLLQLSGRKDTQSSGSASSTGNSSSGTTGAGPSLKKTGTTSSSTIAQGLLSQLISEDATVGASSSSRTVFPQPQKVMVVGGAGGAASASLPGTGTGQAGMLFGGIDAGWSPLTDTQVNAAQREEAIRARYDLPPQVFASLQRDTVSAYWAAVAGAAQEGDIAPHRREWEDGVLNKLASSTALSSVAGGKSRKWVNPSLLVPSSVMDKYGRAFFTPPQPRVAPGDAVEAMFGEIGHGYIQAVKRSIVEYDLQDPRASSHHGLDLHILDTTRYLRPAPVSRPLCDVTYTAVPLARLALARSLYCTENVQSRLLELWHAPRVGSGEGSPYSAVRLTAFSSLHFQAVLPATVRDFTGAVQTALESALEVLRGQWHKEAGEVLASFVLELDSEARRVQAKAEEEEKRKLATSVTAKRHGKDAGDGVQAAGLDPLYRDFARAASALLLARQYSCGEAIGQEWAKVTEDAVNAIIRKADEYGPAPPLGQHQPGYLLEEDDIEVHAGGMVQDPVVATVARVGLGLKGPPATAASTRTGAGRAEEKKDESAGASSGDEGGSPRGWGPGGRAVLNATADVLAEAAVPENSRPLAALHAKAHARKFMDPYIARLIGLTAAHLASMPLHQLKHLISQAHARLESRDAVHARRLRYAFNAASVAMSICLRTTVYAALEDYTAFLRKYLPSAAAPMASSHPGHTQGAGHGAGVGSESKLDASGSHMERKSGDGDELMLGSSSIASLVPSPSTAASPALKIHLGLSYGSGATVWEVEEEEEHHHGKKHRGGSAAHEGKHKEEKKKGEERRELSPEQVAANAALQAAADEVHPASEFVPSADLKRLWAGQASVVLEPTWAAVGTTLQACTDAIVSSVSTMPRLESVIAAASTTVTFQGKAKNSTLAGQVQHGQQSFSSKDLFATPHISRNIASVDNSDEAVLAVHSLAASVASSNEAASEAVRAQYDRFMYLYGQDERKRLIGLASDPLNTLEALREQLVKLDGVCGEIDATTEDAVDCGLVSVVTVGLKDALKARVRALQTCVLRHIKAQALHKCEVNNVEYARCSAKLQFKPSTTEQLVALTEFSTQLDSQLHKLHNVLTSKNGIADGMRLILLDGLSREWTPMRASALMGLGPVGDGSTSSRSHGGAGGHHSSRVHSAARSRPGSAGGGSVRSYVSHASVVPPVLSETEGLGFTPGQVKVLRETLGWPERIARDYAVCSEMLTAEKSKMVDALTARAAAFDNERADINAGLTKLLDMGELKGAASTAKEVASLGSRLEACLAEGDAINLQQELLELTVVAYEPEVKEMQARHAPFDRMWQAVAQYAACAKRWYSAPLASNNADEATKEAEGLKVTAAKSIRELPEDATAPKALMTRIKDDLEKFLGADIQLLALLANPGLKERHWQAMEQAVGFSIPHTPKSSLSEMLERKLETKIASIEEFCVTASKEYSLEKALDRMEGEWAPVTLDLKAYKTTGTHILGGASSDVVQALLDDHIVKSSTMAASRYAKALEGRIKGWVSALTEIQSVLDVWLKVQSTWLYLEPIFGSEDIMKQMPLEGQRFKQVDETWRVLVKGAVTDPVAQRALRQPGQLAALTECHTLLEQIQKGLNAYLESKRLIFPRFFFLSNDELLEILAETKDPQRVQPHLPKCFEGVNALEFDAPTGNIMAMLSVEGERVGFPSVGGKAINPADSKGAVEMWLLAVEDAMKRACAKSVDEAMEAYPKAPSRSQWAIDWPGQAVLAVTCTYWTHEVEEAIKAKGAKGLVEYGKKCTSQIEDIIMKVRGKLTSLARKTLGALVVLDVHARDVTVQMGEAGVETVQDFEWNSQLRLYWAEGGESARTGKPGSVTMKMINAVLQYAYEYLGNSTRLVVTPLTDRCYRTLMGAIHLGLGGAPEGPAGTGKTETTKDLAKAVAIQCVVFNCSDGLDYIAMGKFFKGLASSGAWACFDEFNRIELEVLSVVAQQVLTIQRAIRERKERFVFEGTELSLRWTASAFITMNPGYAGRSELPDNLKALFRSVAMMVPDYAMISEIMLYSYGYLDARPMARKIVSTYKLCSEQLSSQDHYDYGMRAVMAVLRAAGNLKRTDGDLPEGVLVLRAIVDVNLPKFLAPDVPLFHAIVKDLFPGVEVPPPDRARIIGAMKEAAHDLGVQLLPVVIEKVLQIYEMMIVRHGFMLVGLPWAGKTTCAKILQLAMGSLHEQFPEEPMYSDMIYVTLNPKSITMGQLYGQFDDLTHEWTDGVLATKFRDCAQNKIGTAGDRKWVVFDGPVDAVWIENMNTVLDDNKKLCLTSGEIIQMSGVMSMVFEVMDLAAASPATVSRCGMIYMEPASLGWKPLVTSWLEKLAEDNPRYLYHPAHPTDKAALDRAAKEEAKYFEDQEKAAQEDAANKAKGGAKKRRARASDLNPNDPRPFTLDAAQRAQIEGLCNWLVEPVLVLLRRAPLAEYCPSQDTSLVSTLLAVLEASLTQLVTGALAEGAPGYHLGSLHLKGRAEPTFQDIEALFMFALIWSAGATCNEEGRAQLSQFLWSAVKEPAYLVNHPLATYFHIRGWKVPGSSVEHAAEPAAEGEAAAAPPPAAGSSSPYDVSEPKLKIELPEKGIVHDHWYSPVEGRWREWTAALPKAEIAPTAQYSDIIVPTVSTAQFDYLVHLYITAGSQVLVCGPTGVGKSAYMKRMLLKSLPKESWLPIFLAFSARTSAKATQAIMEQKLERRRKGVYGPPSGTRCVIFVDDLNMPEVEKYGAQPPIELLRQFADQGGWYDLAENAFKQIEDAFVVSAMGPPGGGRSNITPRMVRHFNLLCFTDFNEETLKGIFSTVMNWYLGKNTSFAAEVVGKGPAVVAATMEVYKAASKGLRPTPAKSHYTFNLRDFSRVIEGLFMVSPETGPTAGHFTRAWAHEVSRVFYDRLTVDEDRSWLLAEVKDITKKNFGLDFDELFQPLIAMHPGKAPAGPPLVQGGKPAVTIEHFRMLMWGDYMAGPGAQTRSYGEVTSLATMVEKLEMFMVEYNAQAKKPLDLVMFLFFMEHVSRIARVLKMPGGHALLVGVGGSGRRCASTLASYINECALMGIELSKSYGVTEWKDDLKRILKEAGTGQLPAAFIFVDTQIKWEGMLEDINAILNSGEVPGLFAPDERADICEKMGPFARAAGMGKDASPAEMYALFIDRCKRNLHILLCMSPIGDAFRDRLRKFPSLVNCCTIDWFKSWPEDALTAVAYKALKPLNLDGEIAEKVVDLCQHFHQSALHLSESYLSQARRYNYVTPTSYLELLSAFRKALEAKRGEVSAARNRYVVGLEKLEFATQAVNTMQAELTALGPTLEKAQVDTAELMKVIEARLPSVEATRAVVGKEAAVANEEAAKVGAVKAECEADLAVALPVLEGALAALDTITPADINNIKVLANPPANVKLALSAVCVMLGEKPEKVTVDGKKVDDYWGTSRKMMNDSAFLGRLKGYDLNNIDPKRIKVIREVYLTNENFKPEIIKSASSAAEGMCKWVCAMDQYEKVAKVVEPKKQALAAAESALKVTMDALAIKQGELKAVEDELGALMTQLDGAKKKQDQLAFEVDLCQKKLVRASQLIGGLGGEKMRWTQSATRLQTDYNNLTGDVLLASGVLAYLGAFTMEFRRRALEGWLDRCFEKKIPCSVKPRSSGDDDEEEEATAGEQEGGEDAVVSTGPTHFQLSTVLGDPIAVRQWQIEGLPTDSFSTDNGIIVTQARRWALMIDPQGQANKWIRAKEKSKGLIVTKQTDPGFLRTLENAIQFGRPVLLENVGEELDPALEPVLLKVVFKQGGVDVIRLGDSTVEYDDRFKLYLTTKLRNPHYLPETSTKVTLVNFMITPDGLADQLLGIVSAQERPDLEEEKNRLILQSAENNKTLKELEDKILYVLSSSEGNILEDESAINILNSSKELSNDIAAKQQVAAKTEAEIDSTRAGYTPVAQHASRLFFCISDLGAVDPMYQYSMAWFTRLFVGSIQGSKKSDDLKARIESLNTHFTYSIYRNVCRSLFEKDKLLFAFLLCISIMGGKGEVDGAEWFFLLTGGVAADNPHPNPAPAWLGDKAWGEFVRLSALPAFTGLYQDVAGSLTQWKRLYDHDAPHKQDLPGKWGSMGYLTRMQKLCVLRCIRPDKLVLAVQEFVGANLGPKFLAPPPFDLKGCYEDSSPGTPLVFVLSAGSDPMAALLYFAEGMKAGVHAISLGQGQGPIAEAMIDKMRVEGGWVVLQNCHLAVSWMPTLERIVEQLALAEAAGIAKKQAGGTGGGAAQQDEGLLPPPHPNFRLWLTSYPSAAFPVSILQNGVKMTNEPPKGIRLNVKRTYLSDPVSDPSFFSGVANAELFRRMLFGLAFFHAMIQERRAFGPLGFNIPYEFNDSDLRISAQQLAMFLDDPVYAAEDKGLPAAVAAVPYKHLRYLTGECNYGGRVTDGSDRITLTSILSSVYCPDIFEQAHPLCSSVQAAKDGWLMPGPEVKEYKAYLEYIENSLPAIASPEVFGLHENANISKDQAEVTRLFDAAVIAQAAGGGMAGGGGGGGGKGVAKTKEETIGDIAADILARLRPEFDLEAVGAQYPNDPKQSMNTVLIQELARYNRLLAVVRSTMTSVQKAMKGLVVLSATLEGVANDCFLGRVPEAWKSRSFSSRKPLAAYFSEFLERIRMLDNWIEHNAPPIFWISGFFFTQSFLTGASQNYARKYTIPIDDVVFDPECMPEAINKDTVKEPPADGVYVYGMYLDGCKWNYSKGVLDESEPKVLFAPAPTMLLRPCRSAEVRKFQAYSCPLYKTSDRRGVLATTGHSSNFVMRVPMPSDKDAHHWIRRGVCMLLSLDN